MEPHPQLSNFIAPYEPNIQELALELRRFVTETIPEANELIWDNYNALAIAYSKSEKLKDAFCHLALYSKHVNFGFNRGTELVNPTIELKGTGKLIRHFTVNDWQSFPQEEMKKLIWEAVGISEKRNPDLIHQTATGVSLVMSVSEKKIRPKKNSPT